MKNLFFSFAILCLTTTFAHAQAIQDITNRERVQVRVGKKMKVRFEQHGSVGIYAEYQIGNDQIVAFVKEETRFKNPKNAEMPGGDAATGEYIFQAKRRGTTHIIVKKMFRGNMESEKRIQIVVR